ncbi:MAG: gluconolaconase [Dehalococcoidia bacterium]|nr:gluconolaconase [Dehalococcoidia bacterium]MQG15615.1 SMP-30/gluconolactonase/LRE family protein [SAR202 cluster bacterium]
MSPELIADYANECGEGPLWNPVDKKLYWVDIPNAQVYRYDPASDKHELYYQAPNGIGGFTIQSDGSLLCFMDPAGMAILENGKFRYLIDEIKEEQGRKFNDVIADPVGRVFAGTIEDSSGKGRLYRFNLDGTFKPILDGIGISNGMGFTLDKKKMYYTDSTEYRIDIFDYDIKTGDLSNRKTFVQTPEGGLPDGMTVDSHGNIWSARFGGYGVYKYTASGVLESKLDIPMRNTTSLIFGGEHYNQMYITSAGGEDKALNGEYAGALYRVDVSDLGVSGVPEFFSRIVV